MQKKITYNSVKSAILVLASEKTDITYDKIIGKCGGGNKGTLKTLLDTYTDLRDLFNSHKNTTSTPIPIPTQTTNKQGIDFGDLAKQIGSLTQQVANVNNLAKQIGVLTQRVSHLENDIVHAHVEDRSGQNTALTIAERDAILAERDNAIIERDAALVERDLKTDLCDRMRLERDIAREERDNVNRELKAKGIEKTVAPPVVIEETVAPPVVIEETVAPPIVTEETVEAPVVIEETIVKKGDDVRKAFELATQDITRPLGDIAIEIGCNPSTVKKWFVTTRHCSRGGVPKVEYDNLKANWLKAKGREEGKTEIENSFGTSANGTELEALT